MFRRAWLQVVAAIPFLQRSAWAATAFGSAEQTQVQAIAEAVLPESLGAEAVAKIARSFDAWVAGYRPGADMEHGYGRTRMSTKPASPLRTYQTQLAAMGAKFASLPVAERRERLAASMTAARVTALPLAPSGQHIASDLMAFWFRSAEANDVCFARAIRRYDCRGFSTAGQQPKAIR